MLNKSPIPIAFSAAGNSVSRGTAVLSNSNGLAFGMAGSTITGSYTVPTVPAQFTGGFSTQGNTAGDTGLVTGRMLLVGGNNITLSGSTNAGSITVTVSGGAGGAFSGGFSTGGNTLGDTGLVTGRLVLAGGPNVTLSGSTDGGSITVTISGGAGGANSSMTVSDAATSGTLARLAFTNLNGVTLSLSTGAGGSHTIVGSHNGLTSQSNQNVTAANGGFAFQTLSFSNTQGVSFATSAGSAIVGSVAAGATATGNLGAIQVSDTTYTSGTVSFRNANGISFGSSGANGVSASYTVPTVTNSSMTVSDAATSGTLARLAFTNLNGVTLSLSTGAGGSHTIVGSHNALTSQSNQNVTAGNGGFAFQTLSFSNVNGFSFGTSAGSAITGSYTVPTVPAQFTGGFSTNGNTAGDTGLVTGRLCLIGGPNITLSGSTNAGSISISVSGNAPGAAAENNWHHHLGVNTAGNTTASGSTIGLSGINLTISGTNDSQIVLSAAGPPTLSYFDNAVVAATALSNPGNMTLYVFPLTPVNELFPGNMSVETVMLNVTQSVSTAATWTNQISIGFYSSVNSTQLTLVHSGSTSWGTNAGNMAINDSFGGTRWLTIHSSNFNVAPNFEANKRYWCAIWNRTSNNAGSMSLNIFGQQTLVSSGARSGVMGLASVANSTRGWGRFNGIYSATFSTAMPNALAASDINKSVAQVLFLPQVIFNNVHSDGVI